MPRILKITLGFLLIMVSCVLIFGKSIATTCVTAFVHRIDPNATVAIEEVGIRGGLTLSGVTLDGTFGHMEIPIARLSVKRFSFSPKIVVERPVWDVPEYDNKPLPHLHIDVIDGTLRKKDKALAVNFTKGTSLGDIGLLEVGDGKAEVMLKQQDRALRVIARLRDLDFAEIAPFIDFHHWKPQEGIARGYVTIKYEHGIQSMGGELELEEYRLWNSHRHLEIGGKRLFWKGDVPTGELELKDAHFLALDPRIPAKWGMRMSGSIHSLGMRRSQVTLTGCVMRDGEVFPLAIDGEGKVGGQSLLKTNLAISGEGASNISCAIGKGWNGLIEAHLSHVSNKQLLLVRDGLAVFFPELNDLEFDSQDLRTELKVTLERGAIQAVEITALDAKSVHLHWPSREISGQGKSFKLTGKLPFAGKPQWMQTDLNMELHDGKFGPIEDADLSCHIRGSCIDELTFRGKYGGFQIVGSGEGKLGAPQFAIGISGDLQDLAQLLDGETDSKNSLHARIFVEKDFNLWNIKGTVQGEEGDGTFGGYLDLNSTDHPTGWFETRSISSHVCNLVLGRLGMDFTLDGNMDVSGTVSTEHVDLKLRGPAITYRAKAVELTAKRSDVSYGLKNGKWEAQVPLTDATLTEKVHGLTFSHLCGHVDINQERLVSKGITGHVRGVDFSADVCLEYEDGGHLEVSADEVKGTTQSALAILQHFEKFQEIDLPISGLFDGIFSLRVPFANPEDTRVGTNLKIEQGSYTHNPRCFGENLTCRFKYASEDNVILLNGLDGELLLGDHQFEISAPYIRIGGNWEFDVRVENQTHDLMRMKGAITQQRQLKLDPSVSHLFGGMLDFSPIDLANIELSGTFPLDISELPTAMIFLDSLDWVTFEKEDITMMKKAALKGVLSIDADLDWKKKQWQIELYGEGLQCREKTVPRFSLKTVRDQGMVAIEELLIDDLKITALAEESDDRWDLSVFKIDWNESHFETCSGHIQEGVLTLGFEDARIRLSQLRSIFPKAKNYLHGVAELSGQLQFHHHHSTIAGRMTGNCQALGLSMQHPFKIDYSHQDGLVLSEMKWELKAEDAQAHEMTIQKLNYLPAAKRWSGKGIELSIAPEMVHRLAAKEIIPLVQASEDKLLVHQIPFDWDNHIEARMEFCYSPDSLSLKGELKDGFYWLGNVSCKLRDATFSGNNQGIHFSTFSTVNRAEFLAEATIPFDPHKDPKLSLYSHSDTPPLTITFARGSDQWIKEIQGYFCGFDINLRPKPSPLMTLTGDVSIDWISAARILPKSLFDWVQDWELGSGYQLTGDWAIDVQNPTQSTFQGYFKGKNFEMLGYRFRSLLAQAHFTPTTFNFRELSLADDALALNIPSVNIHQKQLTIPELKINDLRPSLLQKSGKRQGRLKPLVIRELSFYDLHADLTQSGSLTGSGQGQFINTFKRDTTFLDIPKDLISRIGLDAGLLVPVHGEIRLDVRDNRLYFTRLKDSYSEGERSHFYLSKKNPSYISFDGKIHIDIRMKQHVLLKLTEFFTLSIRGTVERPKYSLK